jgi:hypothetical protein
MLPFSGFYLDAEKVVAIVISSVGNAFIYALVGYLASKAVGMAKRIKRAD